MYGFTIGFAITTMAASCVLLGWEMRIIAEHTYRERRRKQAIQKVFENAGGGKVRIRGRHTVYCIQEELCETNDRFQTREKL